MKTKIRMGWLGVGPRSRDLIGCYLNHPQLEIVAVADRAEGTAAEVAAWVSELTGHTVNAFTSYEELVKSTPMDALMIASDPDCQVDYAVDAMHCGLHVMTEVPAAYTVDQCWALVNAVKRTGVKYQLAEQTRHWNMIRQWRKMAQAGEFGKIYYAEGEYLHYEPSWDNFRDKATGHRRYAECDADYSREDWEESWRYRTFRNPMYYMPHELSPLLSVTGGRICKVSSFQLPLGNMLNPNYKVRDLQAALMYNTEDVIFSLRAGFTVPYGFKNEIGAHWYQVKGTKASVETARSSLDTMKIYRAGGDWEVADWGTADPDAPREFREASHGGVDYYPISTFLKAILEDTTPDMDVYRAVESAAPAILAVESAEKGGILLDVPDFRA